ncbi:ABC1-domain-containing protein [Pholiota conissans]|uniref:ABC1-domain-containing protein n=1 Tax=Pholiota conissans TaxID=109636 RepID=A0A9P6CR51_9AGAR|nr:ABC1-domain-containing protein [Pholiota conissans]
MPPGPAYNWLCVLNSTAEILSHAARYKAAQVAPSSLASYANPRKRRRTDGPVDVQEHESASTASKGGRRVVKPAADFLDYKNQTEEQCPAEQGKPQENAIKREPSALNAPSISQEHSKKAISEDIIHSVKIPPAASETSNTPAVTKSKPVIIEDAIFIPPKEREKHEPIVEAMHGQKTLPQTYPQPIARNLQSSKVPSSRIGRLFHYGGLAASLGYGAASEVLRRTGSGSQDQSSVMMTEANIKRLVSKLSQMRGAALKLGQFLSIQDTHMLPPEIDKIFRRVQDSAHYMPDWQMEQVMTTALGPLWANNFASFDRIPFAAASIGQVHTAVLAAAVSPTGKDERVAVKIQFPNIVNSIESDLGYIKILLTAGRLLPKGMFLDKTIQAMKGELADECDYVREASFLRAFRSPEYLGNDSRFKVPWVWDGSTSTVLVMERVDGVSVGEANAQQLTQTDRNAISAGIIELCLKELFELRTMQTDPNWTNFLWNAQTRQIELVDFGATRTYTKEFMDNWFSILQAAALGDRETCIEWSLKVGYLTGEEDEAMLDAHVKSMTLLATPFKAETPQPFSFGPGSQWADITAEIRSLIPVMLQHRLTPPPKETYSLNRKLSGSFLLASRLGARVNTKAIWDKVVGKYKLGGA